MLLKNDFIHQYLITLQSTFGGVVTHYKSYKVVGKVVGCWFKFKFWKCIDFSFENYLDVN
jgi:hypothetical protein